ncbi:MAG: hypothetical protein LBI62_10545 [Candidatus Accumulibacter sp.]|nr:hypothetical protein [Accumulibacter sp.]
MFTLNFKHTSRQAFFHGFMKGMAAPVMLYHFEQALPIPAVERIQSDVKSVKEALSRDWARVGNDMRAAIDSYVEATG